MFSIDTGTAQEAPVTPREYDGQITFRGFGARAQTKRNGIIKQIEICETPQEVDDVLTEHDLVLDALMLDYPDLYEEIREAADDHKVILTAGMASVSDTGAPVAMTPTAQPNVLNKAF